MDTKRLDEYDKRLIASTRTLRHLLRAIWLELGSSGGISEETVISLQGNLALMRAHLDTLQRAIEAAADYSREPACLNPIAHLTPQEQQELLKALYERFADQWDEQNAATSDKRRAWPSGGSLRRFF